MDLDSSSLLASLFASSIGLGLLGYGKKQDRIPHVVVGLVLLLFPYVIGNALAIAGITIVLLLGLTLAVRRGL